MSIPQLTKDEQEHIFKNRKIRTVPELATDLKRAQATIYAYFKAKGWQPFKNEQAPRHASHPFRKQNNKLEAYFIARQIRNANAAKL